MLGIVLASERNDDKRVIYFQPHNFSYMPEKAQRYVLSWKTK